MTSYDAAVVGGGMIGSAIAYGLARRGLATVMLDEGDVAYRAARGNFGLVWVQGKGADKPAYAHWTRRSSDLWPAFDAELAEATGVATGYARCGGVEICLSEDEFDRLAAELERLRVATNGAFTYAMHDRADLAQYVPGLGAAVVGGSYSALDGHVNPLYLLRALHAAFLARGGVYRPESRVDRVTHQSPGFEIAGGGETVVAERVVLAAGLGSRMLAPQLGLVAPVFPLRGEILVTDKVAPFLDVATLNLRQTVEGGCLIGASHDDAGFDDRSTGAAMAAIAGRAVTTFPALADVQVVRSWGALRVMTRDDLPIYAQSPRCPGAFVACGHSGVTLAAAHAKLLADWIAGGTLPGEVAAFGADRFDVRDAS